MQKQQIPTQPRSLPDGPLYFVGVGGAGMSAIAYVLAQRGRQIAGSDPGISAASRARLESVGVTVYTQHDPAQIGDIAALVATDAVNEQNPEVRAARERGIPVFRRPEALAAIFNAGRGIAIAGTHGKTTTTGMVASILLNAGLEPTVLIGGDLPLIGGNARNGDPSKPGGDIVLAESCEAYDGFLYLHPEMAVITNIEADHLDYHGTEEAVYASFRRFVQQIKPGGSAIAPFHAEGEFARDLVDDALEEIQPAVTHVTQRAATIYLDTYGAFGTTCARNISFSKDGGAFDLHRDAGQWTDLVVQKFAGHVQLKVPGQHNILNALAAATVGFHLKIAPEQIIEGLESFTGTGRRFERLGEVNRVLVVDDYAHHPTEIKATLAAARSAYPDRRIVAVFQPHLPSRTRDFMDPFADALTTKPPDPLSSSPKALGEGAGGEGRDHVVLTDIYLAREQPIDGVSSETLAGKVRERNPSLAVHYIPDKSELPARLAEIVRPGDLVLTMGAGDIRKAGEGLLKLLG